MSVSSSFSKMVSRIFLMIFVHYCALGVVHGFLPRAQLVNPHIVGGDEVDIGEVPYMVSIRRFFNYDCGASIIGKYYALSAAHCFVDRDWLIWYGVAAGSNHLRQGSYHYVRSITVHPKFNFPHPDYDVAVVRIWFGFRFSPQISRISLVDVGNTLFYDNTLVVTGWGATSQFDSALNDNLLKTEVKIISPANCKATYPKIFTDRMFCAGLYKEHEEHDACSGDSGSPIVDLRSKRQVGIVSWGIGCGNPLKPGVYTDLSNLEIRQFIDDNIQN